MFLPNQDIIFQEVKLFIEGVQVPFTSIQVNSSMGSLPTASITIPPFPGLMDICRYYQPKVHIFYVDPNLDGEYTEKDSNKKECVLFIGHIAGVSYTKSRAGGYSQVIFNCNHKNALMADVLVDYNSPMNNSVYNNGVTNDAAVSVPTFNSDQSIIMALQGITKDDGYSIEFDNTTEINKDGNKADPSLLNSKWQKTAYYNRLKGFPGVLMNLWNQLKWNPVKAPLDYESMTRLYIPLIEDGIKYFDRLSGHFLVEKMMEAGKVQPCDNNVNGICKDGMKHLVPPSMRLFVQSSVQSQITFQAIQTQLGFSGELTDFLSIFRKLLDSIDYELITLTSPAESAFDPENTDSGVTQALETIVKPQLPFYYSPSCNVYYPYMWHTINMQQDEASIPTRITMTSRIMPTGNNSLHQNYRAPFSIREAMSKAYPKDVSENPTSQATSETAKTYTKEDLAKLWEGSNLKSTTDGQANRTRVGKFEFGRGIRHRRYELPFWLTLYPASNKSSEELPSTSDEDKAALELLSNAWKYRFGDKPYLNPYSVESGLLPYERLLFSCADYRFTMEVAASRAGTLSGIFNPYIIAGYPMDILDPNPVNPCIHAVCAGVTHSITANSISTDINFVAATTYTELANYYLQFINPWLQVALKIVSKTITTTTSGNVANSSYQKTTTEDYTNSIVMNTEAAKIADKEFYYPTLGIGSVAPEDLYDFKTGALKPISTLDSIKHGKNREENPMLSAQGNLALVYRPIETREKIEERFKLTFIDMANNNYNPNVIKYTDEKLAEKDLLEPGESQFLEYSDIFNRLEQT